MGIFDKFKSKKEDEAPIELDVELKNIEVKDMLDFEADTFTVEKKYKNEYGPITTDEWQLKSSDGQGVIYLEREEDDEVEWSISKDIEFSDAGLDEDELVADWNSDDPTLPEKVTFNGEEYWVDENEGFETGKCNGEEYIYVTYYTDDEEQEVTIEQWNETDFSINHTRYVEEYEFSNILKGAK